jgi:Ca2+-binding RTX toxin-like protein
MALSLAAPTPALAGRAEVVRTETGEERSHEVFSTIHFDGAPGERNALTVARAGDDVLIRDDGAKIEPGFRCTAIDEHAVRCVHLKEQTINGLVRLVEVSLGDQDDTLSAGRGLLAKADGGDGDDVLQGAGQMNGDAGDDVLDGGGRLNGGPGRDKLYGGPSGAILNGGDADQAPEPDVLYGRTGKDTVSYEGRTTPVTVDLADPGAAGAAGEGDTLTGIEHIRGGAGHDVLRGDDGPNSIDGGNGEDPAGDDIDGRGGADKLHGTKGGDHIEGGDGDDEIDGYTGADHLSGGAGDDRFDLMLDDRGADRIECGAGADVLDEPRVTHVVPNDCETVSFLWANVSPVRGGRPGGLSFRIRPSAPEYYPTCIGIRLGSPAGSLGRLLFATPTRRTKYVRVPLTARGRRKVHPGARVVVRLQDYYGCGGPSASSARSAFTLQL